MHELRTSWKFEKHASVVFTHKVFDEILLDVRLFLSKLYPSDLAHMLVPMPPNPNYSNNHDNELAKDLIIYS
jgi:hypothetical protein